MYLWIEHPIFYRNVWIVSFFCICFFIKLELIMKKLNIFLKL